jgi:hypothetical protein
MHHWGAFLMARWGEANEGDRGRDKNHRSKIRASVFTRSWLEPFDVFFIAHDVANYFMNRL